MKVQSNKPESQTQISTPSDMSLAIQSDESSDFFAAMIANLLSTPILPESDSATGASTQPEAQHDESTQSQAVNAKYASSQLMSELMVNLMNVSMLKVSAEPTSVTPDINMQSNQTSNEVDREAIASQALRNSLSQISKETSIERMSQLSSKEMDVMQKDVLSEQQTQLQSRASENVYRQTQNEVSTQNSVPELLQEIAASMNKNNNPNKMYAYQDVKNQRNKYEIELQQLKNPDNVASYQSIINNKAVVNEEQLTTVYHSRNAKMSYQPETQNNYIDALVEMSGMINSKTSNLINTEQQIINAKSDGQLDYASTAKTISQPEYELKIELQSQSFDLSGKEVYHANIKIHPPELGAVIAKLKIDKNSAELIIVAENNQVKSIVEANLSQLRESFQKHDINITNVHIDVQNPQSGMSDQSGKEQRAQDSSENKDQPSGLRKHDETAKKEVKQKLNSLIDTYA